MNSQRLCWHFSTDDLYKLGSEQTVHFSSGCSLVYLANWQASSNSLWYSDRWNWPSWKSFPSSGFFVGSWSWRDLEKMIGFILCGKNNDFQAGDVSEIDFTLLPGTNVVRWEKIPKKYFGVLISLYPRLPCSRSVFRSTAKKRRERNFAWGREKRPSRRLTVAINIHYWKPFCFFHRPTITAKGFPELSGKR